MIEASAEGCQGFAHSLKVDLPPLGALFFAGPV